MPRLFLITILVVSHWVLSPVAGFCSTPFKQMEDVEDLNIQVRRATSLQPKSQLAQQGLAKIEETPERYWSQYKLFRVHYSQFLLTYAESLAIQYPQLRELYDINATHDPGETGDFLKVICEPICDGLEKVTKSLKVDEDTSQVVGATEKTLPNLEMWEKTYDGFNEFIGARAAKLERFSPILYKFYVMYEDALNYLLLLQPDDSSEEETYGEKTELLQKKTEEYWNRFHK